MHRKRGPKLELEEFLSREFSPRRFPGEKPSWEIFEFIVHLDNQLF
jgi:hypothetical protein